MKRASHHIKTFIPRLVALFLMLVYFSGIVVTDFVHPLLHARAQAVIHSAANEQDPCHRAIYHGEAEANGGHHSHVTSIIEKCSLCDIVFQQEYMAADTPPVSNPQQFSPLTVTLVSPLSFEFHQLSSSRGPPSLG